MGLFKIVEMIGRRSYRLQLPRSWNQIHPIFNEVLLSPYHAPQFPTQQLPNPPGPVNMEGYPEYEVEEILSARKRGRGIQYLVKWKDYGNEENTWEPCHHLDHAPDLIQEFYQKYPTAVQRIVQVLETTGKSFTIRMKELQGVIKAKTNLRKGYCQDPSSAGLTSSKVEGVMIGRLKEPHQKNGKGNLFPSGGEVQGFYRNDGKNNLSGFITIQQQR